MVRLIPADAALLDAALADDATLAAAVGCDVAAGWATFAGALRATRDSLAGNPARVRWGPRLFIGDEPPTVVGWGGFKGPPVDGVVELGYEIAVGRQGRGLATAATRAMLAEAFADDGIIAVIAHTLPEPNASNHILVKLGFRHDGDRDEGGSTVWRYELRRRAVRS